MPLNIIQKLYRWLRPIKVRGEGNSIRIKTKRKKQFIIRVYGNNNTIYIGENCRLHNTEITIVGNNNHLLLDNYAKLDGPVSIVMQGNATLELGSNSGIRGVQFYIKDGKVSVGRDCMFSYGITIRNNDSHKVLNSDGLVTNAPKDIIIGNHVWICQNSSILKGVNIGKDSIIAFGAVVTKSCPPNSIMAGNPARIVKDNIDWRNK